MARAWGGWVCCNDGLSGPLTRSQGDHWLGPNRWGKGEIGRGRTEPFQNTNPDAPLSGLGNLLPAPWMDKALPWDIVIHLHRTPAKDLTCLHSVIEGHTLACADAWSKGGTHGCPLQAGGSEEGPHLQETPVMGHPRAEA